MRERLLAGALVVPFLLGAAASPETGEGSVELRFTDPEIVESSGLVLQDGVLLTANDSGDTGRIFAVDPATGETVGTTAWSAEPDDVEALAPGAAGEGTVWVGDIGDNATAREYVEVVPVPVGRGDRDLGEVTGYRLAYPDGPHDAEALLAHPVTGQLFVATKSVLGGTLYEVEPALAFAETNTMRALGGVMPVATDGAFFPDGEHLVLRGYGRAVVYTYPGLEEVGSLRLPSQEQGEGLAVDDDELLISSEGLSAPVLRVALPAELQQALDAGERPAEEPQTRSREGQELPEATATERPVWPWFLTGWLGVGAIVVLMWSLRRR